MAASAGLTMLQSALIWLWKAGFSALIRVGGGGQPFLFEEWEAPGGNT